MRRTEALLDRFEVVHNSGFNRDRNRGYHEIGKDKDMYSEVYEEQKNKYIK